jgi:hypothetical protein
MGATLTRSCTASASCRLSVMKASAWSWVRATYSASSVSGQPSWSAISHHQVLETFKVTPKLGGTVPVGGHGHPQQPLHQPRHDQHGEGLADAGATVVGNKVDLPLDRVRVRAAGNRTPDEPVRLLRGGDLIQASPPEPAAPVGSVEPGTRHSRVRFASPRASAALATPLTDTRHIGDYGPDCWRWCVNDGFRRARPPHKSPPRFPRWLPRPNSMRQ